MNKLQVLSFIGIVLLTLSSVGVVYAVNYSSQSNHSDGNETDTQFVSRSMIVNQSDASKSNLTDVQKKFSTNLLRLINNKYLNEGQNKKTLEMQMINLKQYRSASSVPLAGDDQITDDLVYVYIYLKPLAETKTVDPYVWKVANRDEKNHFFVAWVGVNDLEKLASLETVRSIREVLPPQVNKGSVTTEGDAIHRTSHVRNNYSQNGAGVKVGVISNGVDNFASAISSGDLPADLVVLSNTMGGDEGTAMLEIIHDMVPDAKLYFHDHGSNTAAFNAAVDTLVNAGCTVIVDDISWINEPFFEDGTVASHISTVLSSHDVVYISSAGNAAQNHYQGVFENDGSDYHDKPLFINIPLNGQVRIVLQWDDEFGSSDNDYDLFLFEDEDRNNTLIDSINPQDGDDDPLEFITYTNTGDSIINAEIAIFDYSTTGAKTLEVYVYTDDSASVLGPNIVAADSIFGHPAVPDVIAVGAVAASDPGNDDIELFSSQGPVTIVYPSPTIRSKPDLIGIDGVSVSGAGGFSSPFDGTSAAAAHVAAITAQLWGALPAMTAPEIRDTLYNSSIDLGNNSYDHVYGYGRADAQNAYSAVAPPFVSGEFPSNNSYTKNSTTKVAVNITDVGGGINLSSIIFTIDNSQVAFTTTPITNGYRIKNLTAQPYADGIINVWVNATDNSTRHVTYSWSFTVNTTPLSVFNEMPANNSFTSDIMPIISVNITNNASVVNLSSIVMTVNGSIVDIANTAIAGGYMVYNQTATPFTHTQVVNVTVNATDNNNNFMSHNWSFTVDNNAPVLTDTAANPQTIESNGTDTTTLSVNVTDKLSGTSSVTVNLSSIGGAANIEMQNSSNNYWIITNATGVGNGTYHLPINATDNAGNSNTSVNITLYVNDTTSPILSNNMPSTGTTNLAPTISISAKDIGSGINVSSANMTVNGVEVLLANTNSAFTHYFSNITTTPYIHGDTVNVTFNVSDNEGHTSNYSWKFYIDNVTPTISIISPAGGHSTTASSINVSGTVNGTGSPPVVTVNDVGASTTLANFNGTYAATVALSVGTNTIYANVTDAAGNINSTSISVTRTSIPSPLSNGGGGGGGGGGASGEPYENIEFKDAARVYVSKDAQISFTFNKSENDILYIRYKALTSAGYISALVETLKDTSTFTGEAPQGIISRNINIWIGTSGYATEADIENSVIGFKVEKKWIQDNDIEISSIKLNRYHGDEWTALPTERTDEDTLYVYFESQTPGFSPFAITGQKKTLVAPPEPSILKSPAEPSDAVTPTAEVETPPQSTPWWVDLLTAAAILLIIVGAYLYLQKQQS